MIFKEDSTLLEKKIAIVLGNSDERCHKDKRIRVFISEILSLPFVDIMTTPNSIHFFLDDNNRIQSVPIGSNMYRRDYFLRKVNRINNHSDYSYKRSVLVEKVGNEMFDGRVYVYGIAYREGTDDFCVRWAYHHIKSFTWETKNKKRFYYG